MKFTNPKIIQKSEKEFIDTINAELDLEAIKEMLIEKHSVALQEEIEYKNGDLVVYNDNIVYKFNFEIKVPVSVIFNKQGECLEISTLEKNFEEQGRQKANTAPSISPGQDDKVARMASNIADMISEINQGDE